MGWNHDIDAIHIHQANEFSKAPAATPDSGSQLLFEDPDTGEKFYATVGDLPGGGALNDLTDVDTTGVADGDALVYDADTSTWVPGTGGGGGGSYSATIGDGSNTSFQIQHDLGTQDLVVQLWDLTGAVPVEATADADSIEATDADTVTVTFAAPPAVDAYRVVILSDGGTSSGGGGGGGAGDIITDWSYRNNNRSTSAFAWKGNEFTPHVDLELHGMAYFGNLVAGATYQAAVATGTASPGNIASITKSASVTLPGSLAASDGVLWLKFSSPVTLTAGTTYGLLVGRTDSTDTYALPVAYTGGTGAHNAVPMPGASHGRSWRIAKANPDVGDAINLLTTDSVSAGYMFRLL